MHSYVLLCLGDGDHSIILVTHKALNLTVGGVETIAHLIVLKKHEAFMLAFDLKDEKKRGLSLNGRLLSDLVPSSTGSYS